MSTDRRSYLKYLGAGLGVGAVAGVAGGFGVGSANTAAAVREATENIEREVAGLGLEERLDLYNWAMYQAPGVNEAFETTFGVKTTMTETAASNEEILTKARAGVETTGFDSVRPSSSYGGMYIKEDLIEPIDLNLVPNFKFIDDLFKNLPWDPGNKYSVPYEWGVGGGIAYNSKHISTEEVESLGYRAAFDPDIISKYKGRIGWLEEPACTFWAATSALGYEMGDLNHIDEAKDLMVKAKPFIAGIFSSWGEMLEQEDLWLALSTYNTVIGATEVNPAVKYYVPLSRKGETDYWLDSHVMLKGAKHPKALHKWIDFMCCHPVAAINVNFTASSSCNMRIKDLEMVASDVAANPVVYPDPDKFKNLKSEPVLTHDIMEHQAELWAEVQSA